MKLARLAAALCIALFSAGGAIAAGPSDAQIAHIAYTAGNIDIAAGKQAIAKSKNKDVVAFAQEMVRDHTAVNDQALALVKKTMKPDCWAKWKGPEYGSDGGHDRDPLEVVRGAPAAQPGWVHCSPL